MSGVLSATWCPEMLPLPIKLFERVEFLSIANLTLSSNESTEFIIEISKVDFLGANKSFLHENITTVVPMSYRYCESMFQSRYFVSANIVMSILFLFAYTSW